MEYHWKDRKENSGSAGSELRLNSLRIHWKAALLLIHIKKGSKALLRKKVRRILIKNKRLKNVKKLGIYKEISKTEEFQKF